MDFQKLQKRVMDLLQNPETEWAVIAHEGGDIQYIYFNYVMLLAAIPAVALLLGLMIIGAPVLGRFGITLSFAAALAQYFNFLVSPLVGAVIIQQLAPKFHSRGDTLDALKLVAYSTTPVWLAVRRNENEVYLALVIYSLSAYSVSACLHRVDRCCVERAFFGRPVPLEHDPGSAGEQLHRAGKAVARNDMRTSTIAAVLLTTLASRAFAPAADPALLKAIETRDALRISGYDQSWARHTADDFVLLNAAGQVENPSIEHPLYPRLSPEGNADEWRAKFFTASGVV